MKKRTEILSERELENFLNDTLVHGESTKYCAVAYELRGMSIIGDQMGVDVESELMNAHAKGLMDIIGDDGIVVRKSGDAFSAMFLKDKTDGVISYLEDVEVGIRDGHIKRNLSSYAGYYTITENCRSYSELEDILIEAIRIAVTSFQKEGKRYSFCDDEAFKKISEHREVAGLFREAIEGEEFLVFYQPKVETRTYRLRGAEALCRWRHNGEMVLPYKFIPVYEQNGDIVELDFYMLDHVCCDIRSWLDKGREVIRISVNLSREHMGDRRLVERIVSIIDAHDVPHEYIEIELTETSTEVDYVELKEVVRKLHEAGIHTSVDDFGVGYSSMNLLMEMPWDMVKIDRSFIPLLNDDEEDEKRMIMMRSIINMAKDLDIECIAEGVETVEQVVLLKEHGCFLVQGFYFDRPMPVEEFEVRIDELTKITKG